MKTKIGDAPYFPWGDTAVFAIEGNEPPRPPNEFEQLFMTALEEQLMSYVNEENQRTRAGERQVTSAGSPPAADKGEASEDSA